MRWTLVLGLSLLVGCVNADYYAAVAEEATKKGKDTEAGILEDAPCLIGLGAWSRMEEDRKRQAVFLLCVPDAARFGLTMTMPGTR